MNFIIYSAMFCAMNGISISQSVNLNNPNPAKICTTGSENNINIVSWLQFNNPPKTTQLYRVVWSDMNEYDALCNEIVDFQLTGKMKKNGMLLQLRKMGVKADYSIMDFRSLDVDPQTGIANAVRMIMTSDAAKQLSKRTGIKSVEIIDAKIVTRPTA